MKRLIAAALAVSLMTGSFVAQARDHDRDRDRQSRHDDRRDHRGHDASRHDERRRDAVRHARNHDRDRSHREYVRDNRHVERYVVRHVDRHVTHRDYSRAYAHGYRQGRYDVGRYYRPAGYRSYAWHRGARLPASYYSSRYVVYDYADYDLYRPPYGHHWVRVDRDVVLATIATGAIVAVVSDLFY